MVYGLILAGGHGKRMGSYQMPKQFLMIGNEPIIIYSIKVFLKTDQIDSLIVALPIDWFEEGKKIIKEYLPISDYLRIHFVTGGKERIDSLINTIEYIKSKGIISDDDFIITHDAVRPFLSVETLNACISETIKYNFALVVIPVNDTVYVSEEQSFLTGTLNRSLLRNGQTPSGFNLNMLIKMCESLDPEEKAQFTGTIQLVLKNGFKIKIVEGSMKNFKITTSSDLNIAEELLRGERPVNRKILLDCTLRDGGIAIDFDFGDKNIIKIKKTLEESNIDIIELGYINGKASYHTGLTKFSSDKYLNGILNRKKKDTAYVAMIDYGTFDLNQLQNRSNKTIDGIRFAFHKENWRKAVMDARVIIEKGYDLFIQPMVSYRYSKEEFIELINSCNSILPEAKCFTIVDSFGQFDSNTLLEKIKLADNYVSKKMCLGFHAHNNRQLAFSNAIALINYPLSHDLIIDSSIMGMGKGAGNLCTELIIPVLNNYGGHYCSNKVYDLISNYILGLSNKYSWGYSLDYHLSSLYGCTPSYVKFFKKDKRVDVDNLIKLLSSIPEHEKAAYNEKVAFELLNSLDASL